MPQKHEEWLDQSSSNEDETIAIHTPLAEVIDRQPTEHPFLREGFESLELAILASLDGLWEIRSHQEDLFSPSNEIYYSPRFKELLGYADHEFENVVASWLSLIHPEDRDRVLTALRNHCQHRTPYRNVEYRIRTKAGEYRWFRTSGQARWHESGRPTRMAGSICDITERKQAEAALRESEARFQKMAANVPGMIYQFLLRSDGSMSFPFLSSGCRELYELEPAQVQQDISLIFNCVHPEEYQSFQESIFVSAQTLQPWHWEGRVITPSGQLKWIQGASRPEQQSNGDIIWNGLLMDITDRKQTEEALQQSEKRLQAILDHSPAVIYVKDTECRMVLVNRQFEALFGIKQEAIQGKSNSDLFPPEVADAFDINDRRVLATKTSLELEEVVPQADGLHTYISVKFPLCDAEGEPYAVCGISTDITERKQAEAALHASEAQLRIQAQDLEKMLHELQTTQAQLVQTEKMSSLGQLVAGVAHEINNPVNFIYGNLMHASEYTQDLLRLLGLYQAHYPQPTPQIADEIEAIDLDFLTEDLPRLIESMRVGSNRIREIVNSLRNFSRLDEAEQKAVDIHEGIDSTLLILQNRLKERSDRPSIQVIKNYGPLPLVECYAGQLNQVFMNLLSNAIDALEDYNQERSPSDIKAHPNVITIQTEVSDPDWVTIRITDNGPGMDENIKRRIFTPFFTTKPIGKGTGLGLSISYQIITEKHQGRIACNSSTGRGTEFVIEIPLYQADSES